MNAHEGDTRSGIMQILLKDGPVTATDLSRKLNLSAAGIRRHLDNLVEEQLAEILHRRPAGRGRPAKYFRLTDAGRAQFGHAYDELANDALNAIREAGGSDAVKRFAKLRMEKIVAGIDPATHTLEDVAKQLAEALDEHGYAATVNKAGTGVQICQHHCPVAHVAADHPELCEAEKEVISDLLGRHVQALATIADGHGICTTNIPLTIIKQNHSERSES